MSTQTAAAVKIAYETPASSETVSATIFPYDDSKMPIRISTDSSELQLIQVNQTTKPNPWGIYSPSERSLMLGLAASDIDHLKSHLHGASSFAAAVTYSSKVDPTESTNATVFTFEAHTIALTIYPR